MTNGAEAVMGVTFFICMAVSVKSIASVWAQRIDAKRVALPIGAIDQRLERIETAVEAIAIEVERIAEAQRFTAKLDAERESRRISGPPKPAS